MTRPGRSGDRRPSLGHDARRVGAAARSRQHGAIPRRGRLGRVEGATLVAAYVAYTVGALVT
jgi:hypothetical protein